MVLAPWPTKSRIKGVFREIQDFDHSFRSGPDNAESFRHGQVYTIFTNGVRTFTTGCDAAGG
jgi:hypothetical protein